MRINFMASILFILNLISMVMCLYVAKKRRLNKVFWVLMGSLFGPLAIPFVLLSKGHKVVKNR